MKKENMITALLALMICLTANTQTMDEMWDSRSSGEEHPNVQWFKDAKFGMFIHWGLYSHLGGEWNGKRYYGSGEWIMNQARIPVKEYEAAAKGFNPVNFDAEEWAQLAEDAGMKYVVITAKHHEGFAMYKSAVSNFNIVDATPYQKDPMKALSEAVRKRGIQFGFYYSQFQDWYEPNGGKNTWDFNESEKDYQKYYNEKAIPQLKEIMTNYGPLGIVWFDTPGGLTKEQTKEFISDLRTLQPNALFSSRVGHGLGDYRDYGDSEMPAFPIAGAWESIYTHNDSWGFIKHDMNFKTPEVIIRLLSEAASKGGNLMLNVGPDGLGNIPPYSASFLRSVGQWLALNGESIYGTTQGLIPPQQWGVSTSKEGKQYLHVWEKPIDGKLLIPDFGATPTRIYTLVGNRDLAWENKGADLWIDIGDFPQDIPHNVIVLAYQDAASVLGADSPIVVSDKYNKESVVDAVYGKPYGGTKLESLTHSHYYGDWKHTNCIVGMAGLADSTLFQVKVVDEGVYQVALEYSCPQASAGQEAILDINGERFLFRTLKTGEYDRKAPLLFIEHNVATIKLHSSQLYNIKITPLTNGKELFKLKSIVVRPVRTLASAD
ncbi:alpha-L-fucosidase [Parapedobacter soli]|uniref:alpha-L-fucosidase n=1 Tax=Parapedobacter soli TaxID=416955 RepID=UPI0021C719C9|nr:alpha-L-fucosidase [Parapedobacter soli]